MRSTPSQVRGQTLQQVISLPDVAMISSIDDANVTFLLKHWSCFMLRRPRTSWTNTSNVNAPSPSGWTCLWKLKEQTVRRHNLPFTPRLRCCVVWFDFTIRRGGGGCCENMPCHSSGLKTSLTGAHANGGSWRWGAVRAGYSWYDIIRPGDGVLCHALFGFPVLTVAARTPGLGKHVRKGSDWWTGERVHSRSAPERVITTGRCQSHFWRRERDRRCIVLTSDEVCLWKMKRSLVTVTNEGKDWWKAWSGVSETFSPLHILYNNKQTGSATLWNRQGKTESRRGLRDTVVVR